MKQLDERGISSLAGVLIGALVLVLLMLLGFRTYQSASTAVKSESTIMRAQFDLNRVWASMQSDSASAEAVFVPSHDIFGQADGYSWGDGHPLPADTSAGVRAAPGSSGHEIDFYSKDAAHHPHFWAYVFTNGTVAKYTYAYRDANGMAQGVRTAPTWSMPAVSFQTYYLYESQLPAVNKFIKANVTDRGYALPPDVLTQLPYPEVFAGNRAVAYNIVALTGNSDLSRTAEIATGVGGGTLSLPMSYTPRPTNGFAVNPPSLTLGYQGAGGLPSSGSFTATATYYHRSFALSGCGVANVTQSNNSVSVQGETTTFGVTPTAVGTCTEVVTTQDGPTPSGAVQITVVGQIAISPSTLEFTSPNSPSQGATISEPGYTGPFSVASSTCNGYAQLSGGGNGPGPTGVSIQPIASTRDLPGLQCEIIFSDVYNDQAALAVRVDPPPPATPTPFPACNQAPCMYLDASVGDGASYENADCLTGVNQDCHGAYDYAIVDANGFSVDVSSLAGNLIAFSDSSGNLRSGATSAGMSAGQTQCQAVITQTATDGGRNGNSAGATSGPFWFQFVQSGSPYSLGETLNQLIQQTASGSADWPDKTNAISCNGSGQATPTPAPTPTPTAPPAPTPPPATPTPAQQSCVIQTANGGSYSMSVGQTCDFQVPTFDLNGTPCDPGSGGAGYTGAWSATPAGWGMGDNFLTPQGAGTTSVVYTAGYSSGTYNVRTGTYLCHTTNPTIWSFNVTAS
jgi:hypothetical protein